MDFQKKKAIIQAGIISEFKKRFGGEPIDFETAWPLAAWDCLHTETETFWVHINLITGKVISIEKEG